MRICMIAYTFYENDSRVRQYAETLAEIGHKVQVFSLFKDRNSSKEFTLNSVSVRCLSRRNISEKNKYQYFLKVVYFTFLSFLEINKHANRNNFDIIHVHSIPDFLVFSCIFQKIRGTKIILDIHDIVPEFFLSKFNKSYNSFFFVLLKFIEKISIAFSDHVIIANHIWKKRIAQRSAPMSKCTALVNYPNPNRFYLFENKDKPDKFRIIYPGSLHKHQGVDIAVKAIYLLINFIPEIKFDIYGSGSEINNLTLLVNRLKLQNTVRFHGLVPNDKIAKIMARASIGVVPKRGSGFGNEAYSTKIMQFMALGVPVVVSATKVDKLYFNSNIVEFFEPENVKDLAWKIFKLYSDKNRFNLLTNNALNYVKNNNWDIKKNIYLKIINDLLSK